MYIRYNENPCGIRTIDCTVRALATLLDKDWREVYIRLCMEGYARCDMPSSKATVNAFLESEGYERHIATARSVEEFSEDHPQGRYLLATDSHVVPVVFGNFVDTWDSGQETPLFYWEENNAI